ncbi:related to Mechanosensitive ion channel family [Cephalotrichum gorgonifer]|uniref:Mechanosensitive ion channel protein n=1 Tax=Cephalotrichum gorgonifer TaxID=2041049 RepID=A0AAE8SYT1_9PEZI|nr:related to Mechanosensitive ion channel family [Cephalotrichum gorgonifer]
MPPPPPPHISTATTPESQSYDIVDEKRSSQTNNTLFPHYQEHVPASPAATRDQDTQLYDEVELQRAERLVTTREHEQDLSNKKTRLQTIRSNENEDDDFVPEPVKTRAEPPTQNNSWFYRFLLRVKKFPRSVRYFLYLIPGAAVLLAPILVDYFAFESRTTPVGGDGGVDLMWFGIWLEIVWCTLWITRIITSVLPHLLKGVARMFGSNNHKKWKEIGRHLELHTSLFLWMLAVLVSYLPIINGHRIPPRNKDAGEVAWVHIVQKIIISLFVLAALNIVEKILVQWIASTFHQRTYANRIEKSKYDVATLVKLYEYSKLKVPNLDHTETGALGTKTPMQAFSENARQAWSKVGLFAHRIGNDFIGRKVTINHPRKVIGELLRTTKSAHTLARIIFRSLRADPTKETVQLEDLLPAFQDEEEAEDAFAVFDKDLNGDISMAEFEGVCNEVHLEKKAISASMKDLDSVIKRLDSVFMVIVFIIAIIVFISIISGSAAAALGSAGTTLLGLAWMLQATAQEFLQSIIFVFVKHPFDVGDRVTVYGNAGMLGRGDDYYVTEISLLYTEFKKMEGHIVQAPNSILNTLFILNQRRSNGLADPVELKIRFGTTEEQIEELKARMLDYCILHKRDYHPRILTEVKTLDQMRSATMNFVFFHKSSFQNELLRLTRHNRFVTELMKQMVEVGIQGPLRNDPGGSREFPMYWQGMAPPAYSSSNDGRREPHQAQAQTQASGGTAEDLARKESTAHSARFRTEPHVSDLAEDPFTDFQDVYANRRESEMHRIRSVRGSVSARRPSTDPFAHNHSPTLDRTGTGQSVTARRFWSRNRAGSRAPPPPPQPGASGEFV